MPTSDKPNILVVNDDAASLLALSSLLNQHADEGNYNVLQARSGEEALTHVLLHDIAVILLDVNMPDMDGYETARAIRQRPSTAGIPIIFVTAQRSDEIDHLKAYEHGAADFLFTPIIPQILHAKVAVFIALALKNEQLRQQAATLSRHAVELNATNQRLMREMAERRAAERQNRAKDEFLAMLGHELRNPLSAISSATALIGMPGADDATVSRARAIIQRQSQHLARIVDDLLDLSRAMSGKVILSCQPLDLAALAAACVETLRTTGRSSGYQLETMLETAYVDGDPTRLEQVVSNLLDNALKYTPAGGTITLRVAAQDGHAQLSVQDNGIGIAPELLPHVFEVFVQGNIALDRAQGGLGIGLSLVRRLTELHGGRVSVASSGPGQGSCFTLTLPLIAAGRSAAESSARMAAARREPVLLIEDNEDGREMMAMLLGTHGYTVYQAANGHEGVRLAQEHQPCTALIDIGLPGIDGYEVARRLRADPATSAIRLIAVTGYGLAQDQQRVMDAGFDQHLVKPVAPRHLLDALEQGGVP